MGYESSSKTWATNQLLWNATHLEDSALVLNDGNTKPITMMVGGLYRSSAPAYTTGDVAVMHFTTDGKLMVDTELTVDGNIIIDNVAVWATNIADTSTTSFGLVDANGHPQVDVLTMPGSLTGYAEDTAHTTGDIGLMPLTVRQDTPSALAGTDGDYQPLSTNDAGALYIESINVAQHDVAASNFGNQVMVEAKDYDGSALSNTVVEGDAIRPAASLAGIQYNMLTDSTGGSTPIVGHDSVINAASGGTAGVMTMLDARSSQITAVTSGDAARPTANLYGEQVMAGYTWATQSLRTEEIDPIPEKFVSETLADVTNATDGTFNYYFDMNGFRYFTLQIALTQDAGAGAGDVYCYATVQDDGTAPGSCTYQDVTNALFGVSSVHTQNAATQVLTASDMWVADTPNGFKYVNVKVITTTGNTSDWTIYLKKFY